MEWLWTAQVTVNFLFLLGMIFYFTERKSHRSRMMEMRVKKTMEDLEKRAGIISAQSDQARRQIEEHFSLLHAVGDEAQRLLQRGRQELEKRIPSLEEQELLMLSQPSSPDQKPQTATQPPISEMPGGLKAILREQLL